MIALHTVSRNGPKAPLMSELTKTLTPLIIVCRGDNHARGPAPSAPAQMRHGQRPGMATGRHDCTRNSPNGRADLMAAFPKRQHYVPKTLLNHFCDDDGWLWVGRKDRRRVFRQRPQHVFVRNHIYTRRSYTGASPSAEYEHVLSGIENDATPVISRIVGCARRIEPLAMSPTELRALQTFVFALASRTPESQRRVSRQLSADDLYSVTREDAEEVGYDDLPDSDAFLADSGWRDFAENISHNADASFAAGDDPRVDAGRAKFAAETGVRFAVIQGTTKSFVIGSHGMTNCDARVVGRYLAGAVLPLAHDVLAHITPWPCTPGLLVLRNISGDLGVIDAVNKATATQSEMFAGNSETLIRRLLN